MKKEHMAKQILRITLLFALLISLCACDGSPGSTGSVTGKGNPLNYFVENESWNLAEVKAEFGSYDHSEETAFWGINYVDYKWDTVTVFGKGWDLELSILADNNIITGGSFSLSPDAMSKKQMCSYRDKILAFYTEEYGEPQSGDVGHPFYSWELLHMTIGFEDAVNDGYGIHIAFATKGVDFP